MNELDHVDSIKNGRLFHIMSCELTVRFDWSSVINRLCSDFSLVFYQFFVLKSRTKENFSFIYSYTRDYHKSVTDVPSAPIGVAIIEQ